MSGETERTVSCGVRQDPCARVIALPGATGAPRREAAGGADLEVIERRTERFRLILSDEHVVQMVLAEGAAEIARLERYWRCATPVVLKHYRLARKIRVHGELRRRLVTEARWVSVEAAATSRARWHAGRARGQRVRMSTVAECGEGTIVATCQCCGQAAEIKALCSVVRLCARCMQKRAMKNRGRFSMAFGLAREAAKRMGLLVKRRPGGVWSERHIVLTVPHVLVAGEMGEQAMVWDPACADRQATAARRIHLLFKAWGYFNGRLQAFYRRLEDLRFGKERAAERRKNPKNPRPLTYRAFEWTPGSDAMGHPHYHLWNFGPYLPERDYHEQWGIKDGKALPWTQCEGAGCAMCKALGKPRAGLRSWWAEALRRQGVEIDPANVIVTVRRVWAKPIEFIREIQKPNGMSYRVKETRVRLDSAGDDVLRYLEGWCVALVDPETRERCGDDVIAGVYMALEKRRLTQATSGFLAAADERMVTACDCGDLEPRKVEVLPVVRAWARTTPSEDPAPLPPMAVVPPKSTLEEDERRDLALWHARTGGLAWWLRGKVRVQQGDVVKVDHEAEERARIHWAVQRRKRGLSPWSG